MVVAGNVKTSDIKELASKWFGSIPAGNKYVRNLVSEKDQTAPRREIVEAAVPNDSITIAFHMDDRLSKGYYACDLLSDILSQGQSSRLYRRLLKEQSLFSEINAYISGNIEPGLFVIEGKPNPGISIEHAEQAIWDELMKLTEGDVLEYELEKVKNKTDSTLEFAELSILNKAMSLAYFELLGDPHRINQEVDNYLSVTLEDIHQKSQQIFRKENSSTLIYIAK